MNLGLFSRIFILLGSLSSTSFIKLDKPRTISYPLSNYSSKVSTELNPFPPKPLNKSLYIYPVLQAELAEELSSIENHSYLCNSVLAVVDV